MPHRDPTVRSRELGEGLREAMQRAGLNGKQAAKILECTPGYVSMLLSATPRTPPAPPCPSPPRLAHLPETIVT